MGMGRNKEFWPKYLPLRKNGEEIRFSKTGGGEEISVFGQNIYPCISSINDFIPPLKKFKLSVCDKRGGYEHTDKMMISRPKLVNTSTKKPDSLSFAVFRGGIG